MSKKQKQCFVPGMYHPLRLQIVSPEQLSKHLDGDKDALGCYDHLPGILQARNDLVFHVKEHTTYHELAHHIIRTLKNMKNEEDKCDVLATYLINLSNSRNKIIKFLK